MNVLRQSLHKHGITSRMGRPKLTSVTDDGVLLATESEEALVDWVLLGTGRAPYTSSLGLNTTQVRTDANGFIQINDQLQTAEPNIYAIGDCCSPEMTANQALADATTAVHNIVNTAARQRESLWVPKVIYSATTLARLGRNEEQAEDEGFEPAVGFAAFSSSPQALWQDDSQGFVRLIADMDMRTIVRWRDYWSRRGRIDSFAWRE